MAALAPAAADPGGMAIVAAVAAPAAEALQLMPHEGHVLVQQDPWLGDWWLVHLSSGERSRLPPTAAGWEAAYGEDGFGVVVNLDTAAILRIDELLSIGVWQNRDGEVFLDRCLRKGLDKTVPLRNAVGYHMEINIRAAMYQPGFERNLTAAIFDMSKLGCKVFVAMKDIYVALGMTAFGGKSYHWTSHCIERWEERFAKYGLQRQILRSKPFAGQGLLGDHREHRTLDYVAASFVGCLCLLGPWAFASSRNRGGVDDPNIRENAIRLSVRFLGMLEGEGFGLCLSLEKSHTPAWPGFPRCGRPFVLQVNESLQVDLTTWPRSQPGAIPPLGSPERWLAELGFEGVGECSLGDLFAAAARGTKFKSLFGQLCLEPGRRMDTLVSAALPAPGVVALGGLRLSVAEAFSDLASRARLDKDIVAYVAGGKAAIQPDVRYLSLTFDKSRVFGLPLLNSVFCLLANVAFFGVPQVQVGTSLPGLVHFQQPPPALRGHWSRWPKLCVACDQESVNMTALSFLERRLSLNLETSYDPSHSCWNDIKQMARQLQFLPLLLLYMVCWNMPHGYFEDDGRHEQARSAVEEHLSQATPSQSPLFMEYCGQILADRGEPHRANEPGICMTLWQELQQCHPLRLVGYKVNMNRFLSVVDEGLRQAKDYTFKLMAYELVAIEMDMLHSKGVKRMVFKEGGQLTDHNSTTKAGKMAPEAKALKAGCQNNLVLSVMVMGDPMNRLRLRLFLMVTQPVYAWHREQNTELRSTGQALNWLDRQTSGGDFLRHIEQVLLAGNTQQSLTWIGFRVPHADSRPLTDEELEVEEELAQTLGVASLTLAGCRLKRHLWMLRGWPTSAIRFLGADGAEAIADFRADLENHRQLVARADGVPGGKTTLDRSCFNLVSCQQLEFAMRESDFEMTEQIREHIRLSNMRILGSQVVEDSFNVQKNTKVCAQMRRHRRPEVAYGILCRRKVLSDIHHYDDIRPQRHDLARDTFVAEQAYTGRGAKPSLNFSPVVSTSSSPDWHSPQAQRHATSFADLDLVHYLNDQDAWHVMDQRWLCAFMRPEHSMVVRLRGTGDQPPSESMLPLAEVQDSAAFFWPVETCMAPDGVDFYFVKPRTALSKPLLVPVVSLHAWEAKAVVWRSPAWMHANLQGAPPAWLASGCHAQLQGEAQDLAAFGARAAFWAWPKPLVDKLAEHLSVPLVPGGSLYDNLLAVMKHCLPDTDADDILSMLAKRLAAPSVEHHCYEALMSLDDTTGILDARDEHDLKVQKKSLEEEARTRQDFKESWKRGKRARVEEKLQKPGASTKPSKKDIIKEATRGAKYPKLPMVGDIEQSLAKQLAPKGGAIWRGSDGAWQAHYKPYPRISRSWRRYSERVACILCLQYLWERHLESFELTVGDCPINGLFAFDVEQLGEGGADIPPLQAAGEARSGPGAAASSHDARPTEPVL